MPIEIVPKRKTDRSRSKEKMKKRMTPKSKTSKTSRAAAPFMMPGQKRMLDKMMGKSKPQTLKGGGGVKMGKPIKAKISKKGVPAQSGKPLKKGKKLMMINDPPLFGKKNGGSLKAVPQGNKGKGLSKLPTEVRNKMGYMKKGGKVMKMRGGGAAMRGINFKVM